MRYFSSFPYITYSLDSNTNPNVVVTNLFKRIGFLSKITDSAKFFYSYSIKESDTPEIIAHKLYGRADYYWIVTMFNNIIDPLIDWPKSYLNFQSYIIAEYGSLAVAQNTTHHYNKIITKTNSAGDISVVTDIVDADIYATLTSVVPDVYTFANGKTVSVLTTRELVSVYDYEYDLNEEKRTINLLKVEYLTQIATELKKLSV